MKTLKTLFGIAAMASIVVCIGACSTDQEKAKGNNDTPSDAATGIVGRGITETRAAAGDQILQPAPIAFTDQDIEWFNSVTREIRFRDIEPAKNLEPYRQIDFELNGVVLFSAATAITPASSRIVCDLVLYIEHENGYRYYLHDGYPLWAGETEQAQANAAARAVEWSKFLEHLKRNGKLREYDDSDLETKDDNNENGSYVPDTPNFNRGDIELAELPRLYPDDVKNLTVNTLYVIRSEQEMRQALAGKSYKGIDFKKNTLLLVRMTASNGIVCLGYGLTCEADGYTYSVTAFTDLTDVIGDETAAVLAPAIPADTPVAFSCGATPYIAE